MGRDQKTRKKQKKCSCRNCRPSKCCGCKKTVINVTCTCCPKKRRKRCPKKRRRISKVTITERVFRNITTLDQYKALPAQDTSKLTTYSYAIINKGNQPTAVKVQVGPNLVNFADDAEITIDGGKTGVVVPEKYLYFTRLAVQSKNPGKSTALDIYFQGQSA